MPTWTEPQVEYVKHAAAMLRGAQQEYMADRGNDALGEMVGAARAELDKALGRLMRGDGAEDTPFHDQELAQSLIKECIAIRMAQQEHLSVGIFDREAAKPAGKRVAESAQAIDGLLARMDSTKLDLDM